MSSRLTKAEWVRHGLTALSQQGPGGLKVGAMAADMGVSRGSFYWHFADIEDFKNQVLDAWAVGTTEQVRDLVERLPEGGDRLVKLLEVVFGSSRRLDRAIRAWSASEPDVARRVAAVDQRRVRYVEELLRDAGVDGPSARLRAAYLYWSMLGQAFVANESQAPITPEGMVEIATLFRSPAPQATDQPNTPPA